MLALNIAKTKVLPAALTYQNELATLALSLKDLGKTPSTSLLDSVIETTSALEEGIKVLAHAMEHEGDSDLLTHATHYRDSVIPAMLQIRTAVDTLEGILPDEVWPLPTYQEMLFIK
jgi:glutamine synthetase